MARARRLWTRPARTLCRERVGRVDPSVCCPDNCRAGDDLPLSYVRLTSAKPAPDQAHSICAVPRLHDAPGVGSVGILVDRTRQSATGRPASFTPPGPDVASRLAAANSAEQRPAAMAPGCRFCPVNGDLAMNAAILVTPQWQHGGRTGSGLRTVGKGRNAKVTGICEPRGSMLVAVHTRRLRRRR